MWARVIIGETSTRRACMPCWDFLIDRAYGICLCPGSCLQDSPAMYFIPFGIFRSVRHSGNIVGHCKLGHFDILRARSVDFTAEELLWLFPGLSEGVTCVTFEFEWGQLYLGWKMQEPKMLTYTFRSAYCPLICWKDECECQWLWKLSGELSGCRTLNTAVSSWYLFAWIWSFCWCPQLIWRSGICSAVFIFGHSARSF